MPAAKGAASKEDEEAKAALAKMEERPITAGGAAVLGISRPRSVTVVPNVGAANPVDAFLRHAMQAKGLKPSPPADRRTLIRRAYLDMTGLPPTSGAGQRVCKRSRRRTLLRRWSRNCWHRRTTASAGARHWLDVVRYADSGGFEYDRDRPTRLALSRLRDPGVQSGQAIRPVS